jgi:hypothetical protein
MGFFENAQGMVVNTIVDHVNPCCRADYSCSKLYNKPFHLLTVLVQHGIFVAVHF